MDEIGKSVFLSCALFLGVVVTYAVVLPVQAWFLPTLSTDAALIYLPFGIKILAAYFNGWRSVPYLLPGALLANLVYFDNPMSEWITYATLAISYGTPPAVFALLDWSTLSDRRRDLPPRAGWRVLVVGGLISSLLSGLLLHLLWQGTLPGGEVLSSMMKYIIGDFAGLAATLAASMAVNRALRRA
ncbi:MAG: hypothetical protein ACLFQL_02705 [Paracoccaceae bacterium]